MSSLFRRKQRQLPARSVPLPRFRPTLELLEDRLAPAVVNWDGGGGDFNWGNRFNWSNDQLPTSSDDAVIGAEFVGSTITQSSGTANVRSVTSAANLRITGGTFNLAASGVASSITGSLLLVGGILSGTGTLTVSGSLEWSGTQLLNGTTSTPTLVLGPDGTGRILGAGEKFLNLFIFRNEGILAWEAGNIRAGSSINRIDNVGLFDITGNGSMLISDTLGFAPFNNTGTLRKSGGDGVTDLGGTGSRGWALNNHGLVEVLNGTLRVGHNLLTFVFNTHTGHFQVAAGATLSFVRGIHDFTNTSSITGDGTVIFTGATTQIAGVYNVPTTLVGGTGPIRFNSTATTNTLTFSGGSLAGSGVLTVGESFTWSGGQLGPLNGTVRLGPEATGRITGTGEKVISSYTLHNQGALTWEAGNLRGVTGQLRNDGLFDITADTAAMLVNSGQGTGVLTSTGTLRRSTGAGSITIGGQQGWTVNSTGTVEVLTGTLQLTSGGTTTFNDPQWLTVRPGATLRLTSSVLGTTGNVDLHTLQGTLVFAGGTSGAPRLLEVMSQDLGSGHLGYQRNFALGTLRLEAAFVRLVDQSNNPPGAGGEALYVDTLIVPAGSTLDLNSRPVYARIVQIEGTLLNGTVNPVPESGVLPLNSSVSGTIAIPEEVDEWLFFGHAGQLITAFANPGDVGAPPPASPTLGRVRLQVLDPEGNLLAEGSSSSVGETVRLSAVGLPVTGNYRLRVQAHPDQPLGGGNYLLTLFNASIDVLALVPNQRALGFIDTPFNIDRWTFAASANQQMRLNLLANLATGLNFTLTGPDDWVGFANLTGSSELLVLPADGVYTLEALTNGVGAGHYAFVLEEISQTALTVGEAYAGTMGGPGHAQLFTVTLTEPSPLHVTLDLLGEGRTELYLSREVPPTRRDHTHRHEQPGADHLVSVPLAAPGTWYILVYGAAIASPTAFTIRAATTPFIATHVAPQAASISPATAVSITGAGFVPGTQVELVADGGSTIAADQIISTRFNQVIAVFNLIDATPGVHDVRLTSPSGQTDTLTGGFTVLPVGPAHLETRLILPPVLGRHITATLYVEYTNTSAATMLAPILTLQSADPDDSDRPLLTLDESRVIQGFWGRDIPAGFAHSVQIYAQGATPGVLEPGEKVRVPVYYIGLLNTPEHPWNFSDNQIEFEILIRDASDPTPVNWEDLKPTLRPDWITPEAWEAVYPNLVDRAGTTWGDYIQMLSGTASYLNRFSEPVRDVNVLFSFALRQANGFSPFETVTSSVDAALPTPGLALQLTRSFGNTITERHQVGLFGRGWSTPALPTFSLLPDGTAILNSSADVRLRFTPDTRRVGAFFSPTGFAGTLQRVNGLLVLTYTDGTVARFNADGKLDTLTDINGHQLTYGYTDGRWTSLTHSTGAFLTIAYNAAGLIASVTDSTGAVTTYSYDPSNTYLLSATGPGGTVHYTYSVGQGAAREHALTSETGPDGSTRHLEYDAAGRLRAIFLDEEMERIEIAYIGTGRVQLTDQAGTQQTLFFDHRGLVVRSEDSSGNYTRYEYGPDRRLQRETDSFGSSRSYVWCACGQLKSYTDELGNTVQFALGGPRNQPTAFIDALGNVTLYGYNSNGHLARIIHPDGTVEEVTRNSQGDITRFTNRRGQSVNLTYTAGGLPQRQDFPDGFAHQYTYNDRGQLTSITSPEGVTELTYDVFGQLIRVSYPGGRFLEYSYDGAGRRSRLIDQDGLTVHYLYDAMSRLSSLRDTANELIVRYFYDSSGRVSVEEKGNGTSTRYTYDQRGLVETITHRAPDHSVNAFFHYSHDASGRRTSVVSHDGTWNFTYDLTGQLTRAVFTSTNPNIPDQDLSYRYDAAGNRIQTISNGAVTAYTVNNMNQYTAAGATSYEYDADGHLVRKTDATGTTHYTWNVLGRLIRVSGPAGIFEYEYDPLGNRTAVVANGVRTEYLVDPIGLGDVVGSFSGTGERLAFYVHGLGLEGVKGVDGWAFYDFDVLGSTTGLTGSAGTLVNSYAYDPFGGSLLSSETLANPFEFVGQLGVMNDGNGLHFMRARYYDAASGRFTAQDPIGLAGGDQNLYRYAANDPIQAIDPTGHNILMLLEQLSQVTSLFDLIDYALTAKMRTARR